MYFWTAVPADAIRSNLNFLNGIAEYSRCKARLLDLPAFRDVVYQESIFDPNGPNGHEVTVRCVYSFSKVGTNQYTMYAQALYTEAIRKGPLTADFQVNYNAFTTVKSADRINTWPGVTATQEQAVKPRLHLPVFWSLTCDGTGCACPTSVVPQQFCPA